MTDAPTKISSNRQKKMDIVSSLSDKFGKANAVVFTNYAGLTHKQIEDLKRAIKPLQAEFVVAKNSLLERSVDEKNKLEGEHELSGQTGTLFLYNDVIEPLKALAKTIKELNLPNVKFGIMEGNFITGDQVIKLSTLPNRETLLTQLAVTLKSPISNLHRAMNWNLQKLVLTLNAVAKAKPADAAPAPATSEPVTAEQPTSEPEPETIAAETKEEKLAEQPSSEEVAQTESKDQATEQTTTENQTTESEGGEN